MKKPELSPDEWKLVRQIVWEYGTGNPETVDIFDKVVSDLLDVGSTDHLVFEKPGEVYEAIKWVIENG